MAERSVGLPSINIGIVFKLLVTIRSHELLSWSKIQEVQKQGPSYIRGKEISMPHIACLLLGHGFFLEPSRGFHKEGQSMSDVHGRTYSFACPRAHHCWCLDEKAAFQRWSVWCLRRGAILPQSETSFPAKPQLRAPSAS